MSCLLWESEFYEDGESIAQRIAELVPQVSPAVVAAIAVEARTKMKLRHVPLHLARQLARKPGSGVAALLPQIIQRADELAEFLAIYWEDARQPLAAQVKKGLAAAFRRFDEYQLAKYDRDGVVKLRDVLFMVHAKPKDEEQAALWKRLIAGEMAAPDTWEVALSATKGEQKREAWERLLDERKLFALALIRNLRNMLEAGVPVEKIKTAIAEMKTERALPFRFIAAARYAPQLEPDLDATMLRCLANAERLPGRTALLVDVSGSMDYQLSGKSEMTRMDVASGLAVLAREVCASVRVFAFSDRMAEIPPRRGLALRDAVQNSMQHGGTNLGASVAALNEHVPFDRLIVLTDEQSHDAVPNPNGRGYMVNVASYRNGVGYGPWVHIDGWSEAILDYIRAAESA